MGCFLLSRTFRFGLYHRAKKYGKVALELSLEDERLKANLDHHPAAVENKSAT